MECKCSHGIITGWYNLITSYLYINRKRIEVKILRSMDELEDRGLDNEATACPESIET